MRFIISRNAAALFSTFRSMLLVIASRELINCSSITKSSFEISISFEFSIKSEIAMTCHEAICLVSEIILFNNSFSSFSVASSLARTRRLLIYLLNELFIG